MLFLLAGPLVALIGIGAVFIVLRRKSIDKRSMYSVRRLQIEHKVRAARQRTLTPHGHAEKAAEAAPAEAPPFAQTQAQPMVNYPTPSYQAPAATTMAPPTPPPSAPPPAEPQWEAPEQPQQMPWQQPPTVPPPGPAPAYDFPPPQQEPFRPAPEPTPRAEPSEPAWTPAPQPMEPAVPIEQPVAASAPAAAAGGWSIVTTSKETAEEGDSRRRDGGVAGSSWQLASGEAPTVEGEEPDAKRPSGTLVAVAQYAVLVVGLVMVLIGVLVMVANSHVT